MSKGSKIGATALFVVLVILGVLLYLKPVDTWVAIEAPLPPPRPAMRMKLPAMALTPPREEDVAPAAPPRATPRPLAPNETPDDFVAPSAPAPAPGGSPLVLP
jgi:hypothetical protein